MRWTTKKNKWSLYDSYEGARKRVKLIVAFDLNVKRWYFYGGGHNSAANNIYFDKLEVAKLAAEKWVDANHKTARKD